MTNDKKIDALDELLIKIPKCRISNCKYKVNFIFVSPKCVIEGYCKRHFGKGEWLKRQDLFVNWKLYKKGKYAWIPLKWVLDG
jgi:hypothetical protein